MPDGVVLQFDAVSKHFGRTAAVTDLSARIEPGSVTGFLGPNGAGKTTSLRMLLGLIEPSSGRATVGGAAYRELSNPIRTVGAALEATDFHPGRSGAAHLRVHAIAAGVPRSRVEEVLELVGLSDAAGRKVRGYSLGMRQRLGLATAMLGDPGVVVLDEPANGLDPEGIRWMRTFLRALADEGRTVFISSHLLSEVQLVADRLLIIARGRLVYDGGIEELADAAHAGAIVDAPDRARLLDLLAERGYTFEVVRSGIRVDRADPAELGALALAGGVALSQLQRRGPALEEVFLELVGDPEPDAAVLDAPEPAAAEPAAEGGAR